MSYRIKLSSEAWGGAPLHRILGGAPVWSEDLEVTGSDWSQKTGWWFGDGDVEWCWITSEIFRDIQNWCPIWSIWSVCQRLRLALRWICVGASDAEEFWKKNHSNSWNLVKSREEFVTCFGSQSRWLAHVPWGGDQGSPRGSNFWLQFGSTDMERYGKISKVYSQYSRHSHSHVRHHSKVPNVPKPARPARTIQSYHSSVTFCFVPFSISMHFACSICSKSWPWSHLQHSIEPLKQVPLPVAHAKRVRALLPLGLAGPCPKHEKDMDFIHFVCHMTPTVPRWYMLVC